MKIDSTKELLEKEKLYPKDFRSKLLVQEALA